MTAVMLNDNVVAVDDAVNGVVDSNGVVSVADTDGTAVVNSDIVIDFDSEVAVMTNNCFFAMKYYIYNILWEEDVIVLDVVMRIEPTRSNL